MSSSTSETTTTISTHNQYNSDGIRQEDLAPSPIVQFNKWFREALDAPDVTEPEAMTLSTTSLPPPPSADSASSHTSYRGSSTNAAPRPSARLVLLKHVEPSGFVFFSNYSSRKGQELAANPWASLTFYWKGSKWNRSVRICGRAEKISKEKSQEYFDARPLGSRLGARASPQSSVLSSRDQLEELVKKEEQTWNAPGAAELDGPGSYKGENKKVEVPDYWGGYIIVPDEIEFWSGRNNRLHDRFRYSRSSLEEVADKDKWTIERLAP